MFVSIEDDKDMGLGVRNEDGDASKSRLMPDAQEFEFRRSVVLSFSSMRTRRRAFPSHVSPAAADRLRGASLTSESKARADAHELGLIIIFAFRRRHNVVNEKGPGVGNTVGLSRGGDSASFLQLLLVVVLRRAVFVMASWCSRLSMELRAQASWSFVDINSCSKSAIRSRSCELCIVKELMLAGRRASAGFLMHGEKVLEE
jgi:hypothetical protein